MTIVESIKCVLQQNNDGLTSKQIYDEIIRQGLYSFGAENPVGVVNAQLRRRCIGLDFPTAYPIKFFEIAGYEGKKIKFRLISTENTATIITAPKTTDISELLPEEKIKAALQEHLQNIRQQVFDSVLNNSPEFFEHLVVDLLLKMGYGYDKNSGIVTGKPHDGGIDGIISEDKLGLDLIYIQAKRFANGNKVTRHDLQAFIGAMEHINKGVFITTSSFTRSAIQFIEKQQQIMHFKIAKSAQSYFNNIMNLEGSHAAEDKNKFIQFDVYYCCALIGMAAGQIDEDTSELKDLVERYPVQYRDCKAQIAGLLVASEARRLGIDTQSPKLEQIMLQYLSNNDTLLSEDGIKTLNAYALKGYRLITDYPLFDKPTSREEFLDAFNVAMRFYEKKDS